MCSTAPVDLVHNKYVNLQTADGYSSRVQLAGLRIRSYLNVQKQRGMGLRRYQSRHVSSSGSCVECAVTTWVDEYTKDFTASAQVIRRVGLCLVTEGESKIQEG